MNDNITIGELTTLVANSSNDFEKTNSEMKKKYYIWNIEAFNSIANSINESRGSFGTGYPFYALGENFKGTLPIISEQFRYNRQLIKDGETLHNVRWLCANCLKRNYSSMPDLKQICKPCPNVPQKLKPRKFINRLPDLDMWIVAEDQTSKKVEEELILKLSKCNFISSDIDPLKSIHDVYKISQSIKENNMSKIHLPLDVHIIEYSKLKSFIEQVPSILSDAKKNNSIPYLPIHPISFRKKWQYDDEAYNFIYDFLSAFTSFNFDNELEETLYNSRIKIVDEYTPEELFNFLLQSATESNFRRFQSNELENLFYKKINTWKSLKRKKYEKEKIITSDDINTEYEL